MAKDLILNSIFLKNRIAELGIKQWWLAEQAGVDRKTVIRWIQGQVKSIQPANAERLAKILDCAVADLTLANEAEQLATPDDQKTAAQLIASSSLVEKLGPIGEWNVIEALLKATVVPNLPINVLGELYNQLTVASWRQSKIDQAEMYNKKAEEIAGKCGDKAVLAGALISKANILSWRGKISQSVQTYRDCLALERHIEPVTAGSTLSNLGAVLYEAGDLTAGETEIKKAIEIFNSNGKPMNLSIAWCHLAIIALERENIEAADEACEKSISFAKQDDYRRGLLMGELLRAEIYARTERGLEANEALNQGLSGFSKLGIEEGLNYEFAGRVSRLVRDFEGAKKLLEIGLSISQDFPMSMAALHCELAKTLLEQKMPAREHIQKAEAIYLACDAPLRAAAAARLAKSGT